LTLLRGSGRLKPFRTQFSRGLPGQNRDSPAYPGEGFFERLGLQCGQRVLRPRLTAPALFSHTSAGAPAVLADVFVAGSPDPGFELDGRVLVELGELSRLGLGHHQPLSVVEDRQQGRVHGSLISFTGEPFGALSPA
jgi:hypothetical protein